MEDFTKGANPNTLAVKSVKITNAADGIDEEHLRASLAAIANHKEPAKINPTFHSYYHLIGDTLQLRAAANGVSKPFAEIIFAEGKIPSQLQIAKLMGAINPLSKMTLKQRDNLKTHP